MRDLSNLLKRVEWTSVTDSVMGGISIAELEFSPEGLLTFSGRVSLENNGGFASVRAQSAQIDLSAYKGLLLKVRGDGKRYSLNLGSNFRIPAGSYRAAFETVKNTWQETYLPLADFKLVAYGREISGMPDFDPARLQSLGFMVTGGQEGSFQLEVAWIRAVE